jgi:hypothetical protein
MEDVDGRPAYKVESDPSPGESTGCGQKVAKLFHLSIWIDQADKKLAKWEGDNIAPITWGGILIRVPAGAMHIAEDMTRREDRAWLPAHLHVRIDAKLLLLKTAHIEVVSTYSDYRKFQADSRIVE